MHLILFNKNIFGKKLLLSNNSYIRKDISYFSCEKIEMYYVMKL